jgi:hypothetical protein
LFRLNQFSCRLPLIMLPPDFRPELSRKSPENRKRILTSSARIGNSRWSVYQAGVLIFG